MVLLKSITVGTKTVSMGFRGSFSPCWVQPGAAQQICLLPRASSITAAWNWSWVFRVYGHLGGRQTGIVKVMFLTWNLRGQFSSNDVGVQYWDIEAQPNFGLLNDSRSTSHLCSSVVPVWFHLGSNFQSKKKKLALRRLFNCCYCARKLSLESGTNNLEMSWVSSTGI